MVVAVAVVLAVVAAVAIATAPVLVADRRASAVHDLAPVVRMHLTLPADDALRAVSRYLVRRDPRDLTDLEEALSRADLGVETLRRAATGTSAEEDLDPAAAAVRREIEALEAAARRVRTRDVPDQSDIEQLVTASGALVSASAVLEEAVERAMVDAVEDVGRATQRALTLVGGSALVALLAIATATLVVTRSNRTQLASLQIAITRIASGDLERPVDVRAGDEFGLLAEAIERTRVNLKSVLSELHSEVEERRSAEEALAEANHEMATWLHQLEKTGDDIRAMAEMTQVLQADVTVSEGLAVMAAYGERLFPDFAGALYLYSDMDGPNTLRKVAGWGDGHSLVETFPQHDCWSLRTNRPLQARHDVAGIGSCAHASAHEGCYACLPLAAHGDVLGTVVLEGCSAAAQAPPPVAVDSAETMQTSYAEHVALALANLRLRARLKEESLTDHLTGLHNRRFLEDGLAREVARARRDGGPLTIALIDIDHFKEFNDVHGHEAGDRVLVDVAAHLKARTREGDLTCRLGGEELVLVWPGMSLDHAHSRAERLRAEIGALRIVHNGVDVGSVTVSIGLASYREHGVSGEALLAAADIALYDAKAEGRDRVVVAEMVACDLTAERT